MSARTFVMVLEDHEDVFAKAAQADRTQRGCDEDALNVSPPMQTSQTLKIVNHPHASQVVEPTTSHRRGSMGATSTIPRDRASQPNHRRC